MVVRVDSFGNIVTNIPPLDKPGYVVAVGEMSQLMSYYLTYDAAPPNKLFLIEGSNKTLEISLKDGNAGEKLHLAPDTPIEIS